MRRKVRIQRLTTAIFLTFIGAGIFVVIKMLSAPSTTDLEHIRVKSEYVLMLLQCVVGALAMMLPGVLERKVQINIPSKMIIVYAVFLYCAIYLGEVHYFYFRIPQWDSILHGFSGIALGAIGFSVIGLLNKSKNVPLSLSPAFVALFAFCFAVATGAVWEIYEFLADIVLKTNMQKYALESGELLVGHAALVDTMKDLIVDSVGALCITVFGYVSSKHETGWLDGIQIKHTQITK